MKRWILTLLAVVSLTGSASAQTQIDTGTITAGGSDCSVPTRCASFAVPPGAISIGLTVSNTFSATLISEASSDNGVTWFTALLISLSDGSSTTAPTSGQYAIVNPGITNVRIRASAYVSGTVTITAVRGYATAKWLTPFLKAVTISQGTLTADAQAISTTATWNNAAITFTGWKENITDSNSANASLLIDLQVGSASKFKVDKAGALTAQSNIVSTNGGIIASAGGGLAWTGRSAMVSQSDGVITIWNNAGTDFTRLQFGGTTSSFPALKRNGARFDVRLADDSGYADVLARNFTVATGYQVAGVTLISATAPTISSCGTGATVSANNGTAAFEVTVGSSPGSTCAVTLPTASVAWHCYASDMTTSSTSVFLQKQTAQSTTSATITNYNTAGTATAFVASDKINFSCFAR